MILFLLSKRSAVPLDRDPVGPLPAWRTLPCCRPTEGKGGGRRPFNSMLGIWIRIKKWGNIMLWKNKSLISFTRIKSCSCISMGNGLNPGSKYSTVQCSIVVQTPLNLNPDPGLCYQFWKKTLKIIFEKKNFLWEKVPVNFIKTVRKKWKGKQFWGLWRVNLHIS